MKLVIQTNERVKVKRINEFQLEKVIQNIKNSYFGTEKTPLKYEVFRYKLPKGVIVIFKDNRVLRARNEWFEHRVLAALAKEFGSFKRGVVFEKKGYYTEVDGVSLEDDILVEAKRNEINQDWVDFYYKKLKQLNYKQLLLVAASFKENLDIPPSITPIKFIPDWKSIRDYYQNYKFPLWIRDQISSRHFRFLLPNGKWRGVKRNLSQTAKHTYESKFLQAIRWLKYWIPVKIYYSMSRLVNPPREFLGRGYPLQQLLAVFDIDADSHIHIIGTQGYCHQCISEALTKAELAEEILRSEGYTTKTVFSGKKGIHLYIMQEKKVLEINSTALLQILEKIDNLTDSVSFRDKNKQFDLHRIIKVPNTIDASTGFIVKESIQKLSLNDQLLFLRSF